ncbi:MAG: ATP-binding cassette domain-containing protein [Oscillospiraceae bacterium]|nr:ATP-binding cassette domain-containing protein [Oscillospiraceae bacterium]
MISCENLVKIYKTGEIEVVALQGLDLTVEDGELMAIIGNSGSGKSTLLNMLGGLDVPSAGQLEVAGKNLLKLSKKEMLNYKRTTVGFVWQNPARNLIPYLTAQENVEMPMIICGKKVSEMSPLPGGMTFKTAKERAAALLDLVGLSHRKTNKLAELSGGEQQRVAIAIALANDPKLLLADEPTGAVDSKTTVDLLNLFQSLNQQLGLTIVIVTHDRLVSEFVNRAVMIRDGRTSSEFIRRHVSLEGLASLDERKQGEVEELAVVDRSGRVQIPREYLDTLGVTGKEKLKVRMEEGQIVLTSAHHADGEAEEAAEENDGSLSE